MSDAHEPALTGELELVGSQDAARAMRVEVARLSGAARDIDRPKPRALDPHRVGLPPDPALVDLLLTYARTPSRALWTWARVAARRLEVLDRGLRSALPRPPLRGARSFSVDVRSKGRFEAGPLQIRGCVRRFVESQWGWTLDPERPDVNVVVRCLEDGVSVGADLGGDLTARGYRPPKQLAPIRENLAAQMVALSGWYPDREPLVDPFAGSGTLLAEAEGWARGRPARAPRASGLGFEHHERGDLFLDVQPRLLGLEADPTQRRGLEQTVKNRSVEVEPDDFRNLPPEEVAGRWGTERGVVLTNPPYGVRIDVEPEELDALHQDLAAWWRRLGPGWRIGIIGLADPVEKAFGRQPRLKKAMRNGDLRTYFFLYGDPPARPAR